MFISSIPYEYTDFVGLSALEEHGVAIIPDVLTPDQCNEMVCGMWDAFEHLTQSWPTPMNRHRKESWLRYADLYPSHSMLLKHYQIGHAQFHWNLRCNERVIEPFARLWNCSAMDLLVSYDGSSFYFPPELRNGLGYRKKFWMHVDQSYLHHGLQCYQGFVNALDVDEGDATLCVLTGSHRLHEQFATVTDRSTLTSKDYVPLADEALDWYHKQGCEFRCVKAPAGSLVLWDSRTVHCALEAVRDRPYDHFRCVSYVCYMPRSLATNKQIVKHRNAFTSRRMTSHWPLKTILCSEKPHTYGADAPAITPLPKANVSILGYRLAGFD